MQNEDLTKVFDELLEEPLNALAVEAQEGGRKLIGYTCSYIPEPLLSVKGLQPVRMRAPGVASSPMADTYLSSVICSYCRSLLETVMEYRVDALDGWVFASACDHMRRLYDNLEHLYKPDFNHIIDLPHKSGDAQVEWFSEELKALADKLEKHFNVDCSSAALSVAIKRYNGQLETLRSIGELRKMKQPPISGTEFLSVMAASLTSPRDSLEKPLKDLAEKLEGRIALPRARARLMVVGGPIDNPGYLKVIESQGGLVVADRFCFGSIPGLEPIQENGEPLVDLARHSLINNLCPRMMDDFELRVESILSTAREFRADGIIVETMKFCDVWGVEAGLLVDALREAGFPVLRVERDYHLAGEGQLQTRVQAFLESMGR